MCQSINIRKTAEHYFGLAALRGITWLGPKPPTVTSKTNWRCSLGHRWNSSFNSIQQGRGCPKCAIERRASKRRTRPDQYHALARQRSFLWLDPPATTVSARTRWRCPEGHEWFATYQSVRAGSGCPTCAGLEPKVPADYHKIAANNNLRWLGPEVANIKAKTNWQCNNNHRWSANYNAVQQGYGCPVCARELQSETQRKKPGDYHSLAAQRGFRWLGPPVSSARVKTSWQCQFGHTWRAVYGSIKQGSGCPNCSGQVPKTSSDYHDIARVRGIRWLGPDVGNVYARTNWQCTEGHVWAAPYHSIHHHESGCPVCAGNLRKDSAQYHALASQKHLLWLGPTVQSIHRKTNWQCPEGHSWQAAYHWISQGSGCPICAVRIQADTKRKKPQDYHVLAENHGFLWLGPEVSSVNALREWQCDKGHRWLTRYATIQQGHGCPICLDFVNGVRVSKNQRELCSTLRGELNRPFREYNIDVAIARKGVRIAVEYDAWYWHAGNEPYDSTRDQLLIAVGWRVLRVRSNKLLPTSSQLKQAIFRLVAGESHVEIVLRDWGHGDSRWLLATQQQNHDVQSANRINSQGGGS